MNTRAGFSIVPFQYAAGIHAIIAPFLNPLTTQGGLCSGGFTPPSWGSHFDLYTEKYFILNSTSKSNPPMAPQLLHRIAAKLIIILSVIALLMVLSGYTQPPQPDEGTAAHIFQLAIVALLPLILLFLFTADWRQPLRTVRQLTIPSVTLLLAFAALYYLEHYR
jgi:heme/copper-type cytochrome/quinol oxidase subunit 4